jgi:hypothetical protein
MDVTYVSHICCNFFIWILHMFCNSFSCVFQVLLTHVSSVSSVYRSMLQVFSSGCFKSISGVCTYCNGFDGWRTAACHRASAPTSCIAPRPLLSPPFPSVPFPSSRLGVGVGFGGGSHRGCCVRMHVLAWDGMRGTGRVECDANAGVGIASVRLQV